MWILRVSFSYWFHRQQISTSFDTYAVAFDQNVVSSLAFRCGYMKAGSILPLNSFVEIEISQNLGEEPPLCPFFSSLFYLQFC